MTVIPRSSHARSLATRVLTFFTIITVSLLVVWVYAPGIQGPELLDDRSSVTKIGDLKLSPERFTDYVFGDRSGLLGRSVSVGTFVVERLVSDRGLPLSKAVNICLHVLNGLLVTALLWQLLKVAGFVHCRWLAILLGTTWLLHPLHVSTVLYVVQRMAMLATTFMLLGCLAYVAWREKVSQGVFSLWRFLLILVCLLLGMFSKENALLLLPVLLLMELLWFQFRGPFGQELRVLKRTTLSLILVGGGAALLFLAFRLDWLAARFSGRHFSLGERLLTETRILWDYVGQWFWPEVYRMGLYHDDIALSHSVLEPLSTLASVLAWVFVLLGSVLLCRWRSGRYLAFAVLLFLVGHSIESTVWPLELYFEHRNYFPSFGLLLLLGVLLGIVLQKLPETRVPIYVILVFVGTLLAALTSSQTTIWSSRPLLILAHLSGHPDSPRANIDMAVQMAMLKDINAAHKYSTRAYDLSHTERQGDRLLRNAALSCIAGTRLEREQVDRIGSEGEYRPFSSVTALLTFARQVQDQECNPEDAIYLADHLQMLFLQEDSPYTTSAKNYTSLALLEHALARYRYALAYTKIFLQQSPFDTRGLLMNLHFATLVGDGQEKAVTIQKLQRLADEGKLSVQEKQTLALYSENAP